MISQRVIPSASRGKLFSRSFMKRARGEGEGGLAQILGRYVLRQNQKVDP